MKRFFSKIARFFWSWGFLKFILWTISFVVLFYVEEDWRGARAWAATKSEWEAKGESFDYNKFIPPPVPDDQNLAALPLFKMESVKGASKGSYFAPVALQHAMRSDLPSLQLPPLGSGQKGDLPDMEKIRSTIADDYAMAFKGKTPPTDTLAQFAAIFPFLADLKSASESRPLCRFNQDYTYSPPAGRALGLVVAQIKLSRILILHSIIALDENQPQVALEDITLNYQLLSAVKRDPTLVGGLVAMGMSAIADAAIRFGLALHSWNDIKLAELNRTLEPINFLADYQFAMRCESAESVANMDSFKKTAPWADLLEWDSMEDDESPIWVVFSPPWAAGWWDDNKTQIITLHLEELTTVDPNLKRVFPGLDLQFSRQIAKAAARWDAMAPWNIWFTLASKATGSYSQRYAQAQVKIDEARIAIALERYRLAHNSYPDSLDALAPDLLAEVPHDIINGQPYHYHLRTDGTFLLYSVGWNQTDDGGKVVFKKDSPNAIDYNQGDWVWPTPQAAATK